jgi:hypothetical protein
VQSLFIGFAVHQANQLPGNLLSAEITLYHGVIQSYREDGTLSFYLQGDGLVDTLTLCAQSHPTAQHLLARSVQAEDPSKDQAEND